MTIAAEAATLAVALDGCHNFRAVAGWRAGDGRALPAGRLFRSDGLDQLTASDQARLAALGLGRVFDLRSSAEIARAPSRWPATLSLRIWSGAESAAEADITTLMQREGLDGGAFHQAMCGVYARFPDDLAQAVAALAGGLLDPDAASSATLVHCTAGKDRTGFAVAMLLHAVGVAPDDVMADFLLSNACFDAACRRFDKDGWLTAIEARAPGAVAALVGVRADYLQAAERAAAEACGSIDGWLAARAGLDGARRERLAERLLA